MGPHVHLDILALDINFPFQDFIDFLISNFTTLETEHAG